MPVSNAERACKMLKRGPYTCILCDDRRVLTSEKRGIAPILDRLDEDLKGMAAADKIIGRAAAMLLIHGGVTSVYGEVMSRGALELLKKHRVKASYGTLAEMIVNRAGDGQCPMEQAVAGISDPALAPAALRSALEALRK